MTGRTATLNPDDLVNNGTKRSKRNEYLREYMLRRYHQRRADFIAEKGGSCAKCGATGCEFEVDHINRADKSFEVARGFASMSAAKLATELAKCQILCHDCHTDKSLVERGRQRWRHGTLSGYRYCRCDECKEAQRAYKRSRLAK